jgi:hypothetical protein
VFRYLRDVFRYFVLAALAVAAGAAQSSVVIQLDGDPLEFRVRGSTFLPRINNPNFQGIFQVSVAQENAQQNVPPLAGTYRMDRGAMVFTPQFPLQPGVTYIARYKLANEAAEKSFTIPKPEVPSTTVVERVFPTAPVLPENQLKLYVHFSAPMSKGEAFRRIHLIDEQSGEVKLPFLELDEELWDREYRRLTILFDPGRIKRDLVPNREVGPPLREGHKYTLVIDRDWADAKGIPLKEAFRREFTAGPPDRTPLDLKTWRVAAPPPESSAPVVLDFPEPIDSALLFRFIDVVDAKGDLVDGKVVIEREETRWIFTPSKPWQAGKYKLDIVGTLEDLAGNKINRPFDVDTFDRVQQQILTESYSVPFTVGQ